MFRLTGLCLAAVVSLGLSSGAAFAKNPEKRGQIDLLSPNIGGHRESSKPKEIVVIPSKPSSGQKPSGNQPRKLGTGKGAQPLLLPAIQNIREPARRTTTQ